MKHLDPKSVFGQDFISIFGPPHLRRHISTLTQQEKLDIVSQVPMYMDTEDLGQRPSFFQVVNKILRVLQQSQALMGVDLNWTTTLKNSLLIRDNHAYHAADLCYKNNRVQRGIWLRHLLLDILFEFDPNHVLMGLARKLSDGTVNLNNGQHRTCACIIVGIREIPIEFMISDLESVDVDLYAVDNLNTLSSSEYDEFRIRVRRNKVRKAENRTDLIQKDQDYEDIFDCHAALGSRFVEKNDQRVAAKECTGVGNMIKYYHNYGEDIYNRAITINCSVFSKSPMATANCWGIMEFIRLQQEQGIMNDQPQLMDWMIQQAIIHKYSEPKKNGMHLDIKQAYKQAPNYIQDGLALTNEAKIIAAGIYMLCSVVHPQAWAPVLWQGRRVDKDLGYFKIMPLPKSQRRQRAKVAAL